MSKKKQIKFKDLWLGDRFKGVRAHRRQHLRVHAKRESGISSAGTAAMNPLVLDAPYKADSGRTISQRGHLIYEVTSKSRPPKVNEKGRQIGIVHTVDLQMRNGTPIKCWSYARCDCESFRLGGARPCCHAMDVAEALTANILKIAQPPKKQAGVKRYKLKK